MSKQNNTAEKTPVYCEATGKLLARMDENGIYLWCKMCKTEHRILFTSTATSTANWQEVQQHLLPTPT